MMWSADFQGVEKNIRQKEVEPSRESRNWISAGVDSAVNNSDDGSSYCSPFMLRSRWCYFRYMRISLFRRLRACADG